MTGQDAGDAQRPYAPERLPRKDEVGFEAFMALDLRVGRIIDVEDFPQARTPMYKLTVDFGPVVGTLRTSAQLTHYRQEELSGRMVVGALNLGRKKIAGFTSEFLVLGSMDPNGTARLLRLEEGVEPGAPVS